MKHVAGKANVILNRIFGEMDSDSNQHRKFESGHSAMMPLVAEVIMGLEHSTKYDPSKEETYVDFVSLAHYYEQNGDLMRDPEVVMQRVKNPVPESATGEDQYLFFPAVFQQDNLGFYQQLIKYEEGSNAFNVYVKNKLQAELTEFVENWVANAAEKYEELATKGEAA